MISSKSRKPEVFFIKYLKEKLKKAWRNSDYFFYVFAESEREIKYLIIL